MNFNDWATCDTCGVIDLCAYLGDDEHICYRCESAPRHAEYLAELQEKVRTYEDMFHALHFAQVAMNPERVGKLLDSISAWSYAHRCGNGELSGEDQQELIDRALNKMRDLV